MMPTFLCQNNKPNLNNSDSKTCSQQGFTLIECILAIAILSVVVASIVGLQSSIISVTQIASDSLRASWAARSAIAQMQYITDTKSQSDIPESIKIPWITNPEFSILVSRAPLKEIKTSQFLISALNIYNLVNPQGNEKLDVEKSLGMISTTLDAGTNSSSKGTFSNVTIQVKWQSGITEKEISEGFFLIDKDIFKNISLPNLGTNNNNNNPSNSSNQSNETKQ